MRWSAVCAARACGPRPTTAADKLGAKVRRAQMEKIPYMLVVGEKDMAARVVSPRTREGQQQPAESLESLCRRLAEEARAPIPGGGGAGGGDPRGCRAAAGNIYVKSRRA